MSQIHQAGNIKNGHDAMSVFYVHNLEGAERRPDTCEHTDQYRDHDDEGDDQNKSCNAAGKPHGPFGDSLGCIRVARHDRLGGLLGERSCWP